ncbi:virulence factor TspB C-terminal domain-related protein [Acinetobacter haemolyticus]|uniref:virulence factor TspB C-terminal domain-related protein n=1 Tax=Acinetobacter haemolyticus TaxID=29430 RepID=UPI001372C14C|nr:virulence factor TspB C-terminal domain-related protein [Acinetobacter haemolyticus]NAS10260.1 hypothetical protein [Acinetobacter haemolyticus]
MRTIQKIFNLLTVYIISLTLAYTPFFVFASTSPSGDGKWGPKTVTRVGLDDIIEATARKQTVKNGSSVTLEAVVRETVNRQKVGKVLLGRILGGGIGVAGVTALIGAIGWVMEDGTYVKYKDKDNTSHPQYQYKCYGSNEVVDTVTECGEIHLQNQYGGGKGAISVRNCQYTNNAFCTFVYPAQNTSNYQVATRVQRQTEPTPRQKITLTSDMVGDIAVGDYTDPVDSSKDKKDRKWTDVENAYKEDPNNIENDLSNDLDQKFNDAPQTPSKPDTPPQTDGEGQSYPTDEDKGTDGKTEQQIDSETGQPTGQGKFTLPDWCLWAADNCQWHQEDKAHQTKERQVWEDEKSHRSSEKSFWQTVKDFFDWTKEDDLPDKEQLEPDAEEEIPLQKVDINWGAQCPEKETIRFELEGHSIEISIINFEYICPFAPIIKPIVIFGATLESLFILAGIRRNGANENE